MTSTPGERGRRLEQHVAAYFARFGYTVRTNEVMTGRSGGRHELDVLAEKSDPLTSFRVAVECKAWNTPIEKDVVSKLHYVITDLGIHKGLVVSLAGVRSGAHTAGAELGIDIWGPDELRHHLGDSVFADVAGAGPPRRGVGQLAHGWPFLVASNDAERRIREEGKGRLGLRTLEPITWFAPLWVPAHLARLTIAQPQTKRLRAQISSIGLSNLYDALLGNFISHVAAPPCELRLGDVVALKPLQRESQLEGALRRAVDARRKVSAPAAVERHDANLRRLGLPVPCHAVTVDRTDLVFLSVFVGLLQTQGRERLVAVNGVDGSVAPAISHVLTSQLAHVRRSFGAP